MTTLAQKVGDELNAIGAELDVHGRGIVRIGQTGARVEGSVDAVHEKLDTLIELVTDVRTRLDRLEGNTIKAVSNLGARVYACEVAAGLTPPQPPAERETQPPPEGDG